MPVLHQKTARNHAQLLKTKALVEVSGMGIGTHHGIKLKNPEAVGLSPGNTVQNKLLADMQSPGFSADRIACIGDMPAAAFVVGVQDIKPQNIIISKRGMVKVMDMQELIMDLKQSLVSLDDDFVK